MCAIGIVGAVILHYGCKFHNDQVGIITERQHISLQFANLKQKIADYGSSQLLGHQGVEKIGQEKRKMLLRLEK